MREKTKCANRVQERMKKEYKLANANVGDRPQIEEDMSDEEGLFGDHSLTADGKRLRRMMRKRMGSEDLFGDSDDVSGSLSSTVWA
jgi:transcription initiation factor TFIIF subunit alpha